MVPKRSQVDKGCYITLSFWRSVEMSNRSEVMCYEIH